MDLPSIQETPDCGTQRSAGAVTRLHTFVLLPPLSLASVLPASPPAPRPTPPLPSLSLCSLLPIQVPAPVRDGVGPLQPCLERLPLHTRRPPRVRPSNTLPFSLWPLTSSAPSHPLSPLFWPFSAQGVRLHPLACPLPSSPVLPLSPPASTLSRSLTLSLSRCPPFLPHLFVSAENWLLGTVPTLQCLWCGDSATEVSGEPGRQAAARAWGASRWGGRAGGPQQLLGPGQWEQQSERRLQLPQWATGTQDKAGQELAGSVSAWCLAFAGDPGLRRSSG